MPEAYLRAGLSAVSTALEEAPYAAPRFDLLPHQIPPEWEDDSWDVWLLMAGRGTGKTLAASILINRLLSEHRGWQARIIAPTIRDARECVLGATGLKVVNPNLHWKINEAAVEWPNGSRARLYGTFTGEDVERLRAGTNSHVDHYEEFAAWPRLEEAYEQASFGLRLGKHPRTIITTTPKPQERLRKLVSHPRTRVTRATTDDNPHLAINVRERLHEAYDGTRLGRQELLGELLEELEGRYWKPALIDPYRVFDLPTTLTRAVVAIDPAKTADMSSDETGILVVARDEDAHAYVLEDLSGRHSPTRWAELALRAMDHWGADCILVETNTAGEITPEVIKALDPEAPIRPIRSQQAKAGRALPAVALYEQGRVHHLGEQPVLESQMYEFDGQVKGRDDRVDALVLALRELQLTRMEVVSRGWRVYG